MKHIICYSGGHSSALVAIEVVRKYGKEDVILLNHDIHPNVEDADIKRFKLAVANYLAIPVTHANHPEWSNKDQFDIATGKKSFIFAGKTRTVVCTHYLKTLPFDKYLKQNFPNKDCIIYYGFDAKETVRIQRRSSILGNLGYKTDYPLALWPRTIQSTKEIGIEPPMTYGKFKHANCTGCLKAGRQHWYVVYCERPDIWEKAKATEDVIGYSIIKGIFLDELESKFALMKKMGVQPTEHKNPMTFWAEVGKLLKENTDDESQEDSKPCECIL
jgi:hypothetical protein